MPSLSNEPERLHLPVYGGAITRRDFLTWAGAAMALAQGVGPRRIDTAKLQEQLLSAGAFLGLDGEALSNPI